MANYETVILPSSGKTVRVQVDENGNVPPEFLAKYLKLKGSPKNDYDQKADVVLPVKLTPRQAAAWMADPDAYDIESIDVRGKPLRNVGDRKGESKKVHEHIIVYGMPGEEATIRKAFDEAFPLEEQKKMVSKGDLVLESRPLDDGVEGTHCGDTIRLERETGIRNGVIVHEGIHHLRAVDKERSGASTPLSPDKVAYTGGSKDPATIKRAKQREAACVEESCTVAEQMARQKDFDPSGYYGHVQVYDPKTHRYRNPTPAEARKMAEEDRKLFTNGTGKPLTGKAAIESVNRNWAQSNIARLKLGNKMAISTMRCAAGGKKVSGPAKPKAAKGAPKKQARKQTKKAASTQTTLFFKKKGRHRGWRSSHIVREGGSARTTTGPRARDGSTD